MGTEEVDAELEVDADVNVLLEFLKVQYPKLGNLIEPLIVSVNREYATYDTVLKEGDEVALLPPVSGG